MIVKHYKHHLAVNRHFVTEKYAKKTHNKLKRTIKPKKGK